MSPFRHILIADKSPLFTQALQRLLSRSAPHSVIHHTNHADRLQALATLRNRSQSPLDLIIADRCLTGLTRYDQLLTGPDHHKTPVLLMAESTEDSFLSEAWAKGIAGVINKSATTEQFQEAIEQICQGKRWFWRTPHCQQSAGRPVLTSDQLRVLALLRKGLRNKQIAYELRLSQQTVKYNIQQIYRKLDIPRNRILLALTA